MNELAIELTPGTDKCLYQQIYEYIRQEIRTGKLPKNEKLPSTRSLAEYLQISRSTVDSAYGQLLAEGYITAKPCKGYFVCGIEDMVDLSDKRIEQTVKEENAEEVKGEILIRYDFSPHAISMKNFPFATWKKITREILVDANSEMFALGNPQGDFELRSTIGRYLHSSRGVNCKPEQIIIGAGNDYLLMLLEKILGRHIPMAMENPTYRRAYQVFESFGYGIEVLPMDECGLSTKALADSQAKVAYVMPSHQFPTGTVMPIGRRLELLKWAEQEEGRYLIEDDYDSEFRYRGKPIPSLQASDRSGKVIYIGTFSKSIAPAIRVGYMVLPTPLMKKYKENCGFYASTVSRIDQRILNEFIKNGYFERYLNKMRKIYRDKHDFLLEQMKGMEKAFIISGENAGLHLLLTSRTGIEEKELLERAKQAGVRLYGMSNTLFGQMKENHPYKSTVLLGYGALGKEEIEQGIGLLKKAWRDFL